MAELPRGELQRGVVKWFNDAKGFGFIEHTSGRDVFVHYSVIEWEGFKTLKDGEEVDYELCEGDKGLHASRVVRRVTRPEPKIPRDASDIEVAPEVRPIIDQLEVEPQTANLQAGAENGRASTPTTSEPGVSPNIGYSSEN